MKRPVLAGLCAVPLLLVVPTVAAAQDADAPLAVEIDASECGKATITFVSTNTLPYSGDYRAGDEDGEADDVSDLEVEEGPFAGELFGLRFNPTPIPADSVVPVVVDFAEDQAGGELVLTAWVNRGPEQKAYAAVVSATVDTDCEAPVETTPPVAPDDEAPDEVEDDDPADDDNGLPLLPDAPRPTIGVADLPVTG